MCVCVCVYVFYTWVLAACVIREYARVSVILCARVSIELYIVPVSFVVMPVECFSFKLCTSVSQVQTEFVRSTWRHDTMISSPADK